MGVLSGRVVATYQHEESSDRQGSHGDHHHSIYVIESDSYCCSGYEINRGMCYKYDVFSRFNQI